MSNIAMDRPNSLATRWRNMEHSLAGIAPLQELSCDRTNLCPRCFRGDVRTETLCCNKVNQAPLANGGRLALQFVKYGQAIDTSTPNPNKGPQVEGDLGTCRRAE